MVVLFVSLFAGLLVAACTFYVSASYLHAFWHRRPPNVHLFRAAAVELAASLLLLAFWPLWILVGASYQAKEEGEGEAHGRRHPVVLLHGFAMNRTNWVWLGSRLARRGIGPLYGTTYFSPQSICASALHLQRFVERVRRRENAERVDIVAHSLGGLVARYYIEKLGGAEHVGRLVTIGSPHGGTRIGRLGFLIPSAKESLADSAFYRDLGPVKAGVAYTSVWSRADAIIEPPESASIAPAGHDCVFDDLGHLSLLMSPRVLDAVAGRLKA